MSEQSQRNWIRSERARTLRWLAGQIEGGSRSVVTWELSKNDDEGERFVIEVRIND